MKLNKFELLKLNRIAVIVAFACAGELIWSKAVYGHDVVPLDILSIILGTISLVVGIWTRIKLGKIGG